MLRRFNHCWGISILSQTIRKQIGARQSSTALVSSRKNANDLATYSGDSWTEKADPGDDASRRFQMSSVVDDRHAQAVRLHLWFRCQQHAVFQFRCQPPPYSCNALHAELSKFDFDSKQPQRKIRLRFRRQSPDQQQHDAIMDPTNQEDDQWWALRTFRHRHNFTCNYRNFSSRFWTQKSYRKNLDKEF